MARKATRSRSLSQELFRPRVVRDPCARTPRDIHGSREVPHLVLSGIGVRAVNPQGARQRRTDAGSLTASIVAEKPLNKGWGAPQLAEEVEPRGLTKGNPLRQIRSRTQRRAGSEYGQP